MSADFQSRLSSGATHFVFKELPMRKCSGLGYLLSASLLSAGVCLGLAPSTLHAASPAPESDNEMDMLLTQAAEAAVGRVALLEGQSRSRKVKASLDLRQNAIIVHLDRGFVPRDYGPEFEDQRSLINVALYAVAERVQYVPEVKYLYGGFDIYHYFPEIKAEDDAAREAGERKRRERDEGLSRGVPKGSGMAFVAAGHGYYFHHGERTWKTQRTEHNGVMEGMLTPTYAEELKAAIEARSQMPVIRPRAQGVVDPHPESGQEWWRMAARYAIASQYPGNPEIWNTKAGSSEANREYKEDINSRPLLANHVSAEVAIHLHSNADEAGTARGTRIIVQPGRAPDAALGSSVLCAMRELIQSAPGYESFVVSQTPHPEDKGENRLADLPSIIVETAFHTNPDDAAALLDPVFRAASMKGVEKGYRLFRDGKACVPLAIKKINRVTVPSNGSAETSVHFEGNPQFPVTLSFTPAFCSQPGACQAGEQTISEASESPIQLRLSCQGTGYGMVNWSTVMRDADGVTSAPIEHWQTCSNDG
ncbi:N-acetylmuramoyl-L-alanine amidase [Stenotrophomonas sp. VV52]|uniref:N-acetylmuramoyl-L-alanine amidase n=1 Tax=Stenotrophomonas sp. VV52 TaxID=2066958 RepID=UPI000C9E1A50|nr:N-acetylmuramoyl-L-alanine amidase [Stenotrophomonas sp. VV52]